MLARDADQRNQALLSAVESRNELHGQRDGAYLGELGVAVGSELQDSGTLDAINARTHPSQVDHERAHRKERIQRIDGTQLGQALINPSSTPGFASSRAGQLCGGEIVPVPVTDPKIRM